MPGSIQRRALPAQGDFVPYHMGSAALSTVSGRSRRSHSQMLGKKILNYSPKGRFKAAAGPKARLKRFIKEVGRQMCPNHGVTIWSLTLKQGTWPPWNERRGGRASNQPFSSREGAVERKMLSRNVGIFFPSWGFFSVQHSAVPREGSPSHHITAWPFPRLCTELLGCWERPDLIKKIFKKIKIWGK